MEILSLVFEIRFKQNTPLMVGDKRKKLAEIVIGETPKENPPKETMAMEVNHPPSKTRVIIQENRIVIIVEQPNISQAKERLIKLLGNIYREVDFKENSIARIGTRTQWIQEWSSSFTSLMEKYKDVFYQDCSLVKEASDVAVFLTLKHNGFRINYASGPMKPNEAKERLMFKERNLPHDFIFIDIDRFTTEDTPDNNLGDIKGFILNSIEYGQNKASETINILVK